MAVEYHCCEPAFFEHIVIIIVLVLFAGLMSGLTLGLMSLSLVDLEVLAKSGTEKDRKHAGEARGTPLPGDALPAATLRRGPSRAAADGRPGRIRFFIWACILFAVMYCSVWWRVRGWYGFAAARTGLAFCRAASVG